ncbi:hypothetical protein [Agromyces aureus]|uniref:PNPLA domain-containing protein n=1 Tax=Agromyces aureus TaxID=453304 RepID=A0A191WCX3_9MICO|nr:hypothetical protein [Agromyces aureus]ANJ26053.1 hypothetical protein ATC03_04205 [Agromyces aureus]
MSTAPSTTSATDAVETGGAERVEDSVGRIERWVRSKRPTAALLLFLVLVALAAMIVHAELDRLIAGALDAEGRSAPLGKAIGPLAFAARDETWAVWNATTSGQAVGRWIAMAVLADAVLIVAYVALFLRAISASYAKRAKRRLLEALVIAELVEAALLTAAAATLVHELDVSSTVPWLLATVSTVKWAMFLALVVSLLIDFSFRRRALAALRRIGRAIWLHRLSVVLVVLLVALTCIPSDGVLDQLPDLQRQWADGTQLGHAAAAIVATLLASLVAFTFGRMRARAPVQVLRESELNLRGVYAYPRPYSRGVRSRGLRAPYDVRGEHQRQDYDVPAVFRIGWMDLWWGAPIVGLVFFAAVGGWNAIRWSTLVFLAIPVAVVLASLFSIKAPDRWYPRETQELRARYAWLTGDLIAVLIVGVVGLGLVRSLAGPVAAQIALAAIEPTPWSVPPLVLGGLTVLMSPLLLTIHGPRATGRFARFSPLFDLDVRNRMVVHQALLAVLTGAAALLLLHIAVAPRWWAESIGAPALTVFALTLWGVVLGSFTIAVQEYPPLPIFIRLHLRATPVLTLAITIPLIAMVLLASSDVDDPQLHAVRTPTGVQVAPFEAVSSVEAQLDARLDDIEKAACTLAVGGRSVRPALVVAAEGGGIRAAYWTARVFETLADQSPCLADSVLVSSGVSGGSVGMAVTAALQQQAGRLPAEFEPSVCDDDQRAAETTRVQCLLHGLASPETIGVGLAGLLVRDQIVGQTGVHLPTIGMPASTDDFAATDRATLIEQSWIDDVEALSLRPNWRTSTAIGLPVFNSTDARTKCKVLIGPMPLTGADAPDGDPTGADWGCAEPGEMPSALPVPASCFAHLDWAGLAMLSARFPTVTPAARFEPSDGCGDEDLQLVDGGYAEGSALGTVADLAPLIVDRIGEANAGRTGASTPPLVPILVYVKNSAGYDLAADVAKVSAEPFVPIVGNAAKGQQMTAPVLMQRIGATFAQTPGATTETDAMDDTFPGLSVTVAPQTVPTIVPPLGWALSSYSIDSLEAALRGQLRPAVSDAPTLFSLISRATAE